MQIEEEMLTADGFYSSGNKQSRLDLNFESVAQLFLYGRVVQSYMNTATWENTLSGTTHCSWNTKQHPKLC